MEKISGAFKNERRGTVQAIENQLSSEKLQAAFVDYINAQREFQSLMDSGMYDEDEANRILDVVDATEKAFNALEGHTDVMKAYSAWRQENSPGNMDWSLPD